jgi:hypothetical protein
VTSKPGVERGAAEEESGVPLTETEVRASERPPSRGDQPADREEPPRAEPGSEPSEEQGGHA